MVVWITTLCGAKAAAPALVEDLGRREALLVQGNRTFPTDQIYRALGQQMDFHIASHRRAPLAEYTVLLQRKIELGYRHCGFLNTTVEVVPDPGQHIIRVFVKEGPRFRCGQILLGGTPSMTNAEIREKISAKLSGKDLKAKGVTNSNFVFWDSGEPVCFDAESRASARNIVLEALAELNYYQPELDVEIQPDPSRGIADLLVTIVNEGVRGIVEQIDVSGTRINSRESVLEYLKLRPGMELNVHLANTVSNQLAASGRFTHHEARITKLPATGKFKLELDLDELSDVTPLNKEFSPQEQAMLKFGEWLNGWRDRTDDLVWSFMVNNSQSRGEMVLSHSGLALLVRNTGSNSPADPNFAMIFSDKTIGLYSMLQRREFEFHPTGGGAVTFLHIDPIDNPTSGSRFNLSIGAGFSSQTGQPFSVDLRIPPSFLIYQANEPQWEYVIKDGVLSIKTLKPVQGNTTTMRIEASTGRLIEFSNADNTVHLSMRAGQGDFQRLTNEIAACSATHTNEYVADHGFSSGVAFVLSELAGNAAGDDFLGALLLGKDTSPADTNLVRNIRTLGVLFNRARQVLGEERFVKLFEPLNRVFPASDGDSTDKFSLPVGDTVNSSSGQADVIAAMVLGCLDNLLGRDTWPWILSRETVFTVMHKGKYSPAELEWLDKQSTMGPMGSLACALALGKVDAAKARKMAERGLANLQVQSFRNDYRVLIEGNDPASQLLSNMIGLLASLDDAEASLLTAGMRPEDAAFFKSLVQTLRKSKNTPAAKAAWPVFEQHWDSVVRHYLEPALRAFLPQVQVLSDPKALYERGRSLVSDQSLVRDYEEALQCFRKAAAQGHGGAHVMLGMMYEQGKGVTQDYAEAKRFYLAAYELKEPHASCRLGDMYSNGRGVAVDLDEAEKWYRIEGEKSCTGAQFSLGALAEKRRQWADAVKWYRMAAGKGQTSAQIRLGDLLSDGLFVTPDYAEASQWLLLATRTEKNRMLEIQLRRAKAKLTPEQFDEVQERVNEISRKLESENGKQ